MARKGRDLFELLELRARGSAPGRRARRTDWLRPAREWLRQILPASRGPAARRRRSRRTGLRALPAVSMPAIWLGALLVGCLGSGFAVGRLTAAAESGRQLQVPGGSSQGDPKPGTQLERPEQYPTVHRVEDGAPDLTPEEEVRTLSNWVMPVLSCSDRQAAARWAYYLRQHRLDNARIRRGKDKWLVLLYVLPEAAAEARDQAARDLQILQSIPAPADTPRFASRVAGMSLERDFYHLKR